MPNQKSSQKERDKQADYQAKYDATVARIDEMKKLAGGGGGGGGGVWGVEQVQESPFTYQWPLLHSLELPLIKSLIV